MYALHVLLPGGGPSGEQPQLATSNLEVTIIVASSDSPFGVFAFPSSSRELSVAEDVNLGDEYLREQNLEVVRLKGNFRNVMVSIVL